MTTLLHVGYHKTGTTWLQTAFFPRRADLGVVAHPDIYRFFIEPSGLYFNQDAAREFFGEKTLSFAAAGKLSIVSFERLCGSPFSGGRDSKEIADRLKQVFPDAKVLIVIREQIDAIASTYKQFVIAGGPGRLKQFLFPPPRGAYYWFDARHFLYEPLISHYVALFGAENVKIMCYEHFRSDNVAFCNEILEFLGLDANFSLREEVPPIHPSLSDLTIGILALMNRFVFSPHYPWPLLRVDSLKRLYYPILERFDRVVGRKISRARVRDRVAAAYSGMFSDSNRKLESMLDLDLRSLGYE